MREIKFRAWDKIEEKVWYITLNNSMNFSPEILNNVQQYTGLLDKNGKEIYEGDILIPGYTQVEVFEVVFNKGMFCERRRIKGIPADDNYIMDGSFLRNSRIEVIGNIYENPELLKDGGK